MKHQFYEGQKVLCIEEVKGDKLLRWGIKGNIYTVKELCNSCAIILYELKGMCSAFRFTPCPIKELDWNL